MRTARSRSFAFATRIPLMRLPYVRPRRIICAVENALDFFAIDNLRFQLGADVEAVIASRVEIVGVGIVGVATDLLSVRDITDLPSVRDIADLVSVRDIADLVSVRDITDLVSIRDIADLLPIRDIADIEQIVTPSIGRRARSR